MNKGTAYLLGGIFGGIILALITYISDGTKGEIGSALVIGIILGKIAGWLIGKPNEETSK